MDLLKCKDELMAKFYSNDDEFLIFIHHENGRDMNFIIATHCGYFLSSTNQACCFIQIFLW